MNNLYGPKFIVKQRRAGYKSTVYSMAEIVDNSIDARANRVDILLLEETQTRGKQNREVLTEIYFIDNGKGMTKERINGCLTFSEGEGYSNDRIGAFGVGLPNSSISVCKRVEVYSKNEDNKWHFVYLDIDELTTGDSATYKMAVEKVPEFESPVYISEDTKTIVRWSKLDLIDVAKANTLDSRAAQLLGRIYRYAIRDGLEIRIGQGLKGNEQLIKPMKPIVPYDPLFVMEKKNFITEHIWHWAENNDPQGKHVILGELKEEFNSIYHYGKLIEGCERNISSKAPFMKHDDYWDVEYTSRINGNEYKWKIFASFGKKHITHPGVRSGGGTKLGRLFGYKMSGNAHFKSGNIFFMRANREIDFGHFGLYTVTENKNRFWTIEIHFNSDLDNLMGVSNTKQNVEYFAVENSDLAEADRNENVPEGVQREILYSDITTTVKRCIKSMKDQLKDYTREWKREESSALAELDLSGDSNDTRAGKVPKVEHLVYEVLPKEKEWSDEQKEEITKFLKSRYMHLTLDEIRTQVDLFSKGLTRTLVLYAPDESNNLFELKEKKGILITFINTKHIYYENILEPLKYSPKLKVFTLAVEMLISSFSLEMNKLVIENESKYQHSLETYLLRLSSRLNEFIHDSNIKVKPEELFEKVKEELEEEFEL